MLLEGRVGPTGSPQFTTQEVLLSRSGYDAPDICSTAGSDPQRLLACQEAVRGWNSRQDTRQFVVEFSRDTVLPVLREAGSTGCRQTGHLELAALTPV